jgi:CheY-like chemotaxis protein/anti-sigma regulatory factor (Ser/Thr protein kinase)
MAALRVQAERKSITLTCDLTFGQCFVNCDVNKMERVIINIIGNAVKFTPEGGVVDAFVTDDPEREGFVRIAIRDTGIGIPPEAIDKVTLRYFTVGEQPSGSGLGLAISREIVELHGGYLVIQSPPDGRDTGTVVFASLPAVPAPVVLVVGRDEAVRGALVAQLSTHGYEILPATGADDAIAAIERDRPGALVVGVSARDSDGADLILQVKRDKSFMGMPIIALADAALSGGSAELLRGLSIPVLPVPWEEDALVDRLERALLAGGAGLR